MFPTEKWTSAEAVRQLKAQDSFRKRIPPVMKKLKIAVWHNLPSGGGKRQLYAHVKGLIERGHYVESWCPDTADQKHLPLRRLIKENIIPLKAKRHSFYHPYRTLGTVKELLDSIEQHCKACAEEIKKQNFDILFANACLFLRTTPIARYINLPSAIYLGEPYRWIYEALPELPWIAPQYPFRPQLSFRAIRDNLLKRATLSGIRLQARAELEYAKEFSIVLVNSIYSRESILKTYNLEAKICYLGIDTNYFKCDGEQKGTYVIGLGTIYYGKGVDRAIRAVATINKEKRPDLIWVGNGASEHDLAIYIKLAKELGVTFIPKLHIRDDELIGLLSKALAMVYTSRLEPFGLAPLEANACGTAVVGIAEGGVRETIRDGTNGYLAKDDDPQTLGGLIYKFIDDPKLSYEMGARAIEYVKSNWDIEMGINNIEAHLVQLCLRKVASDSSR